MALRRGRHTEKLFELGLVSLPFLYFEAPPHRRANLVGQRVLDHGEITGLHPLPDQVVRDSQDEDTVVEIDGLNARQPQLPGRLGNLLAQ